MEGEEHFDVIVVGTGFGGSVVAMRLAAAGKSVLVLERGQPHPPGAFARTPYGMRKNFWAPDRGAYGLFDLWAFSSLDVVLASGLGGGSLIYANVMLRKDERTFVLEDLGDGGYENWPVTRADLEPHYDRFEQFQRPQRFPMDDGEPYSSTSKTRAMLQAAERMGLECELPPLAVMFAADGESPAPGRPIPGGEQNVHGAPRSTCRLCGECDIGCNYGSKSTLDLTCLSEAWRLGAELRTCCEVRTIAPAAAGERRSRLRGWLPPAPHRARRAPAAPARRQRGRAPDGQRRAGRPRGRRDRQRTPAAREPRVAARAQPHARDAPVGERRLPRSGARLRRRSKPTASPSGAIWSRVAVR